MIKRLTGRAISPDPLREAEAVTNGVLQQFETLVSSLRTAKETAALEHAKAEDTIASLRQRQAQAEAEADRAHRVGSKLEALIS